MSPPLPNHRLRLASPGKAFLFAATMLSTAPLSAQIVDKSLQPSVQSTLETKAPTKTASPLSAGMDLVTIYDDNIFATRNSERGDVQFVAMPSLGLQLGDGNASLNLGASGELGRFRDHSSEDYEDWALSASGRLKVSDGIQLLAGGDYRWNHESRASPDAVNGSEPTRYRRAFGYAGLMGRSGAFIGRIGGTVLGLGYSDVPSSNGLYNNGDRDRVQAELGTRLGYSMPGATEIFVQGAYDRRRYRLKADDAGLLRDSQGFNLAGGVRQQIGKSLSGEVFLGVLQQNYRDPRLADVHTIDFGGVVSWTGARNTSATLKVDRTVEETTIPGASGYVLTNASLGLGTTASSRLLAGLDLTGSSFDFRGVARSEFVMSGDLWVRYWFARHFFIGADYRLAQRTSTAAGYDFDQNRVMLRLGAQLQPRYQDDTDVSRSGSSRSGPYFAALISHDGLVTGLDGVRGNGSNTADFGDIGAGGGAAIGYGVALVPVYLGLEVEHIRGGADWQHQSDRLFSVAERDSYGIAARIGHVTDRGDLLYGRAGLVSTEFRTIYRNAGHIDTDDYRRLRGLALGVGVEASIGGHGFVRGEYVLTSYPDYSIVSSNKGSDNFSSSTAGFRLGAGLRFGRTSARPDEPIDFSGFYLGGGFGHGTLTSANTGPREGGASLTATRAGQGPMLFLTAGGGVAVHSFYLGAELDVDIAHLDWNIERDPLGRVYSVQHDWSLGASARLGYLISHSALVYGRVGAARTRFDVRYTTGGVSVRDLETKTGLSAGGGLEVALSPALAMRIDYGVTHYRAFDLTYGDAVDSFDNLETVGRFGLMVKI